MWKNMHKKIFCDGALQSIDKCILNLDMCKLKHPHSADVLIYTGILISLLALLLQTPLGDVLRDPQAFFGSAQCLLSSENR